MLNNLRNKLVFYFKKLSFIDFVKKVIYFFLQHSITGIFTKVKSYYYFKTTKITLGKNVRIHGLPYTIKFGSGTSIYTNCIFEFGSNSELFVGSNVILSYGVVCCCHSRIFIGNDVQVGEYTSIRDSTHQYDQLDNPMKYAPDILDPVTIEDDVWVGRGCMILPGSYIETGVVVASNSVVKGKLLKNGIYGGAPAKLIKMRI